MNDPGRSSAPSSLRSMTGFASVRRAATDGEVTVSLRSVNHRSLDLHFHGGGELAAFENEMRELLKRHLRRGHVEVRFAWQWVSGSTAPVVDRTVLQSYLQAFRQAASELGVPYQPDLAALVGLPGVLGDVDSTAARGFASGDVLAALEDCLGALNAHREREGDQLGREMQKQAELIAHGARAIREIRAEALPLFHARLREKLGELLSGAGVSEARLAEEAALLADRSDIEEELVRLDVHTRELQELLRGGGEVGKRLDFLLQEMNREANTLLAKSAGAGAPGLRITTLGLAVKASIERIREQALNLE